MAVPNDIVAGGGFTPSVNVLRGDDALETIVVVGGPASISTAVEAQLATIAPVERVDGADRYDVSSATSAKSFCPSLPTVYVASVEVFPEALSGSAAAIAAGSPVLLVTPGSIPPAVAAELQRLSPMQIEVLGCPNTVSKGVVDALRAYLHPVAHDPGIHR